MTPASERLALAAMGTRFELILSGGASSAALRAAGEAAFDEIEELHRRWSAFDPGSLLTRVNRLAAGRPVAIDGDTFAVLRLARSLWEATGGAFDPTVGAKMRGWGFRGEPPSENCGRPSPGMGAVELDARAGTVRFLEPEIELDLGAVAKGVAIDRAGESLRESGVTCAFLHGGTSSVLAIGAPPDAEGWPIALDRGGKLPRVRLCDAALAVSAGRGRLVKGPEGGDELSHVIDPADGAPVSTGSWAAVVADSAAVADAWATALVVRADGGLEPPAGMSFLVGAEDGVVRRRRDAAGVFWG